MYKKQMACLTYKLHNDKWKAEKKADRTLRNNHRVKLPLFKKYHKKNRLPIVLS